jgi:hypothetical protein
MVFRNFLDIITGVFGRKKSIIPLVLIVEEKERV